MTLSSGTNTMKALRFAEFGPPSVLRIEVVAIPEPGEGEALVRVKAAAINPSDIGNVAGRFKNTTLPRTPGRDFAIALREKMFGVLVVGEDLFERRASEAVTNAAREFAQIQALAGWVWRAEEALQAAAQVLRANQEGLGVFRAGFDEADGGFGRQGGEEVFVTSGIEFEAAV